MIIVVKSFVSFNEVSKLSSEFNEYPAKVFELLTYYFLIIYELGTKSYDVVLEVSKYNIVPKLLFAIEKGPLNIFVEKVAFKKSAQLVLNLILRFIDVADLVCTKLELFKWVLRIIKRELYNAKDLKMIEALSLLSFSEEFLPKTDEDQIVSEWVYGSLCMILLPEKRNQEFLSKNENVNDQGFMKLVSFLSQILGNVSKSQGGMEEIIASIETYGVDVVWRIHYFLIQFNVKDFSIWYTVLYLTNNMLRYPYYNPPLYASE